VNASRLESYIMENLERIAMDRNYIENLVFRLNNESRPGYRSGLEPRQSCSKKEPATLQRMLKALLQSLSTRKGVERNLLIREFVKDIEYSPEEIRLNLFYLPLYFGKDKTLPEKKDSFSDGKQKRQPVRPASRTGYLENKSSLS